MEKETQNSPIPSSFWARVTGVFTSPTRTFENVAHHPRFLAPFLATLILFAGFWGVVYLKLGLSGMAVAVVQYLRRGTLVPQDQIDFTLQYSRALAPAVLLGGASVILVHLLVFAWVGVRLADLFFGVRLRLRGALSLVCFAYLAKTFVQTVLSIPMVLFGDLNGMNFGNLLPTNAAFFLNPGGTSRMLYVFLQSLDIVQLWYFALLGMSLSTHTNDRASPRVIATSFAILWIGLNVVFAAFRDLLIGP